MNIGVTGGSGFIGSHLVDGLIEEGHEVTVFDMMKPHRNDVKHILLDITNPHKVNIALTGNYDVIYHLAYIANVNDVQKHPTESWDINSQGTANVLEACKRNGIDRLIFASTVWVYELANTIEVDELTTLDITKCNHPYTASKIASELLCHAYNNLYGLNFTILRYGIPYGSRARGGTVISLFMRRALEGKPLVIKGNTSRNFIYIDDLIKGNILALKEIAENQIYNLDGKESVSIKRIAEIIQKEVGNVEIKYEEARSGDYENKIVSCEKAGFDLRWEPEINFDEGIKRYIKWYEGMIK